MKFAGSHAAAATAPPQQQPPAHPPRLPRGDQQGHGRDDGVAARPQPGEHPQRRRIQVVEEEVDHVPPHRLNRDDYDRDGECGGGDSRDRPRPPPADQQDGHRPRRRGRREPGGDAVGGRQREQQLQLQVIGRQERRRRRRPRHGRPLGPPPPDVRFARGRPRVRQNRPGRGIHAAQPARPAARRQGRRREARYGAATCGPSMSRPIRPSLNPCIMTNGCSSGFLKRNRYRRGDPIRSSTGPLGASQKSDRWRE